MMGIRNIVVPLRFNRKTNNSNNYKMVYSNKNNNDKIIMNLF